MMNERIRELALQANGPNPFYGTLKNQMTLLGDDAVEKFAELIVSEMCGLMEQAEDDVYHCFEPSERPTEYIEWLRNWQERFEKHFRVEL